MRQAFQRFTDLPELGRSNQVQTIIDSTEGEGLFMLSDTGSLVKIHLHSLANEKHRANAMHKLNAIAETAVKAIQFIQQMPTSTSDQYPPINEAIDKIENFIKELGHDTEH
jgi:hypothetical protein